MPELSPVGAPATPEPAEVRTIVAMGGGGFSMEPDNPLLDGYTFAVPWPNRSDGLRALDGLAAACGGR